MKLDSTMLAAHTLLPNTRPHSYSHAIWKISPAAPDMKTARVITSFPSTADVNLPGGAR